MKKHSGKCALCGKECELTFEHIPPRAAFNSAPIKPVSGDKLMLDKDRMPWNTSGLHYMNQQQGMGVYSLCKDCNNNTGSWYGDSYCEIAHIAHHILSSPISPDAGAVRIIGIYPLRFIKQILSMFCSINNYDDPRIKILRDFVQDKNAVGIDKSQYKICMYLIKSHMIKYAPLSIVLLMNGNTFEPIVVSEITAYPMGFTLYFNPTKTWRHEGIDITHFADCRYDERFNIEMPLCIKEMNDIFPTFYRSKEEIENCVEENKRWCEENGKL